MVRYDPRWGQKRRPEGRRHRWEQRPRWARTQTAWEEASEAATPTPAAVAPDADHPPWPRPSTRALRSRERLLQRANALWGSPEDYREHLRLEALEDPVLWECTAKLFQGQASRYRQELTDERLIGRYDAKADKQIRDAVSVLRRRQSQEIIPFSTDARSISYFNQRTPTRVWRDQQQGLRIGEPARPP